MTSRTSLRLPTLIALGVLTACAASLAAAQGKWKAPRTADGHPDLQGNWTNATITPFERSKEYGDRLVLTADEAKKLEEQSADFVEEQSKPTDPKLGIKDLPHDCGGGFTGVNCGYNNFWVDPGTHVMTINGEKRSSIVTDPPNGRVPPMTPEGQKRQTERFASLRGGRMLDGPEARALGERCLMSFDSSAGPPMLPLLYNNNYQIVQNKDTVVILVEMIHDARIVRMNAQHKPANMRFWMGDSIGRWEGNTLVIETTNFRKDQTYRGASENLKVVERLTRVAPNQILYQFRIEDPTTFSQPWGGEVAMNATNEKIYEYACHEGNYALPGILAGAREQEKAAAQRSGSK
jgi:hypothetical protein